MAKANTFLGIGLAPGVKARHMLAYFVVALVTSGYFGAMAMLQPGILALMGVPAKTQGDLAGQLGATQEIIFIALSGIFGVLSERWGRRFVYAAGLLVAAAGYVMFPRAEHMGALFAYRAMFGIGGAAMTAMLVTVVADYGADHHRGRANGAQGFVMVLGAFIPFFLVLLPKIFVEHGQTQLEAQQTTFAVLAALGAFAALLAAVALRGPGRPSPPHVVGQPARAPRASLVALTRTGIAAARDPGVALSYGAAFISRGDLAVTGAFMILWGTQQAQAQRGLDVASAQRVAGGLMFLTILGALVGSMAMGLVADRVSRISAVTVSSGLATAVYLSMAFVSNPLGGPVKGLRFVMGIAELSGFVASQALVGERAPAAHRGTIIGFFGAAGAMGMLVGTFFGGKLFRYVGPTAPFVLFGALNAVVFLLSFRVRRVLDARRGLPTVPAAPESSPAA